MGNKWLAYWPSAAVMTALLLLWQGAVIVFDIEEWFLPGPAAIVRETAAIWPRLLEHTGATLRLTLLGYALGTTAGIAVGMLFHLAPGLRRSTYPLLVLSQNVPIIVLGPLLLMWLGFGMLPKIVLLVLVCFFPVSVAMLAGLGSADSSLTNYMRMIGAGNWTIFRRLELPHAVPSLFSGLKIAAAYSVTSAIVAEWIGASKGLGYFIQLSARGFQAPRVFAAVLIIVLLSMLLFGAVALAERRLLRWRPRSTEGGKRP
ncbi:ABC transporter permease [Paenibacillus sp. IB182496]|uniref:ABC transporter permease n=1 Tax=Paenibacillus sabuli TaxID=2772509 RepID=A0A927BUU0_9BACL|nr:ABC transporter permease [Paenibacillus sabuli]MBD2846140.1 ABC transporter permease [Paenibacillus sabuli]